MIQYKFINIKSLIIWLLLFTVATFSHINAQEQETDEIDLLLDELFFSEDKLLDDILESFNTYSFIYSNVSFNSNTFFSGRDYGVDQFNIVPQMTYYHSSGFNIGVSGILYETYTPNWDFTNVYLGYYNTIGKQKKLNYNISYSHFFYTNGWDIFTNSIDVGLGYRNKNKTLGTKLTGSYLFGKDQALQFQWSSYGNFSLVKQKQYTIKFKPQFRFIAAQQTIAFEYISDINGETIIDYDDIFDLLNTQINIPFALYTRSWDFEVSYNINLPSKVETESDLNTTSFINISVGYIIDLN